MKNKKRLLFVSLIAIGSLFLYLGSNIINQSKKPLESPVSENTEKKEVKKDNKALDKDIKKDIEEKEKEQEQEDLTFLMMGVDEGERSDTIVVCKYFGKTGKISILSIPRDTRTEIPGYGLDKLNHAHAYKGPELSLQAVNNLLGMNIENYVRVDYDLLKEVVNTIEGVDVYIPEDTDFWAKGTHHFDGEDAVNFVRYRAGYYNQDLGRIASQQEFLKQVLLKMKDTKNILAFTKMMKSGIDNINTNIPLSKVLSYGMILKNTDTKNLEMDTLPGVPAMINRVSYIVVDRDQTPQIVDNLFNNDQVKLENKE